MIAYFSNSLPRCCCGSDTVANVITEVVREESLPARLRPNDRDVRPGL
eukprot:SAG11_NODE_12027_length_725_cov_1.142173_1_plen_47_part_10